MEQFVAFIINVLNMPLSGWVLTKLWFWFMVPLGVSEIGVAQAVGISLLVRFLTLRVSKDENPIITAIAGVVISLFALLIGWVITAWM